MLLNLPQGWRPLPCRQSARYRRYSKRANTRSSKCRRCYSEKTTAKWAQFQLERKFFVLWTRLVSTGGGAAGERWSSPRGVTMVTSPHQEKSEPNPNDFTSHPFVVSKTNDKSVVVKRTLSATLDRSRQNACLPSIAVTTRRSLSPSPSPSLFLLLILAKVRQKHLYLSSYNKRRQNNKEQHGTLDALKRASPHNRHSIGHLNIECVGGAPPADEGVTPAQHVRQTRRQFVLRHHLFQPGIGGEERSEARAEAVAAAVVEAPCVRQNIRKSTERQLRTSGRVDPSVGL